jgi:hypothetical protein
VSKLHSLVYRLTLSTPTPQAALLLEIFHELFRGASPEALFAASDRHAAAQAAAQAAGGAARVTASKKDHEASAALRAALGGERAAAKAAVHAAGGAPRHSRFGGTYVRSLAGGGTALVRNTPTGPLASARAGAVGVTSGAFGRSKPRLVGPQRMAVTDTSVELHAGAGAAAFVPPSGGCGPTVVSTHIQAKLKALAEAFLSGPYNALMSVVLGDITVGRAPGLSDHEIHLRTLHFLRIAAFCTAFVRVTNARKAATPGGEAEAPADGEEELPSPWAAISETMEGRAFHWVRTEWLRLCDAKPSEADTAAMAAAGALLHQMLAVLLAALTSSHGPTAAADRRVATALALRVLTDDTADEGVLATLHKMVRTFDPRRFSRTHMATLALAVDTVLRLLQALSDQADGHLHVTRRRAGAGGHGGKKTKKQLAAEEAAMTEEERAAAVAERERLAQDKLEKAARRQERIDAGEPVSDEEEDVAADLAEAGIAMGDDGDEDGGYGSGSDGGATKAQLREVKLDLPKRTARLFDSQTVCNVVWLLTNWRHNERRVNDVAVQLLDRMAALSLAPMLYQVSILLVFQDILGDSASRGPGHEALHSFVRKTVRGMFERMLPPLGPATPDGGAIRLDGDDDADLDADAAPAPAHRSVTGPELAGKMLFVDLLFWKPRGTAVNIELDCGRFDGAGGEHLRSVAANRADIAGAIARDAGGATTTPEGAAQPPRRKRRGGLLNEQQAELLASLFEAHKDEPKKKVFATTLCAAMSDGGCPLKRSQLYAQLRGLGLVRPDMVRKPRDGDGGNPMSRAQRREAARQAMNFDEDDDAAGSDEEDEEDDGEVAEPGGSGEDDDGDAVVDLAAARAALGASRLAPRAELANPSRILAAGTMGALRAAGVLDTALQWLTSQLEAAAQVPDTMPVDGQEDGGGLYTLAVEAEDAAVVALLEGPHAELLAPLLHALALRRPDAGEGSWRWRVAPGTSDGTLEALRSAQAMHDMQHAAAEERAQAAAEARRARIASLGGGDKRAPLALLPGGASQRGVVIRRTKPGAAQPQSRRRSSAGAARKPAGRRRAVLLEDDSEEEAEDASGASSESEPEAADEDEDEDDAPQPVVQSYLTAGRGRRATAPVDASQPIGLPSQGDVVGDVWAHGGGGRQSQPSQRAPRTTQDVMATVFGSDSDDSDSEPEAAVLPDAVPASVPVDLPVTAPVDDDGGDEDMDVAQAPVAARKRVFKRTAGGAAKRQAVGGDSDSDGAPVRVRGSQAPRRVMVLDEDSD